MRLANRDVLLLGVDDPHRARDAGHLADAAERALELDLLAAEDEQFLLGGRAVPAVLLHRLELLEALQALEDGLEVGEHPAEPALVDVGHADACRLLGDGLLGLLLGADEHHAAAVGDRLLDELVGAVDVGQRLLQVDDVDAVALSEDEALHLRVPAAGLMPEVHAGIEHFLHGDDGHAGRPPLSFVPAGLPGARGVRPRLSPTAREDRLPWCPVSRSEGHRRHTRRCGPRLTAYPLVSPRAEPVGGHAKSAHTL